MVGDGYTDYEVKKYNAADIFIAYTENINRKSVVKNADIVANNFDKVIEEFMRQLILQIVSMDRQKNHH